MLIKECVIIAATHDNNNVIKYLTNDTCCLYTGNENAFNKELNKNCVDQIDLTQLKKVFYDPMCKYPRFRLADNTDVKRCLKVENADAIIVSDVKVYSLYDEFFIFKSDVNNKYYRFSVDQFEAYWFKTYFSGPHTIQNLITSLVNERVVASDARLIYKGKISIINDELLECYKLSLSSKMRIHESVLDNAISLKMNPVDKNDLDAISELISSPDTATVDLGVKMLLNYDVIGNACAIGMFLLRHKNNIIKCNASKSVGFINLLKSLGLKLSDLDYNLSPDRIISIMNQLTNISKSEEDVALGKAEIIRILEAELGNWLNYFKPAMDKFKLKLKYTIE